MNPKRRKPLSIIGRQEIRLQNRLVGYTLKQSPHIRGIRLEIRPDSGLAVIVPRKYSHHEVDDILEKKAGWILRHMPDSRPRQMPLFKKEVDHGERIPFMGKMLELVVTAGESKTPSALLKGGKLYISPDSSGRSMAGLLESWYRQQAELIFKQKADRFQEMMGVSYNLITIRGQHKRWASASPLGNLSLNWKLLLAPEYIIDYVIMHELAHFKHMDHSRKFWDYLARFCPRWRQYRKWLLVHEDELKAQAGFGR